MRNEQEQLEKFMPRIQMREKIQLEQMMPLIRERLKAGYSAQFTTRGVSMLPLLRNGKDQVVLSPLPEKLKKYDLPLYQRDDGHYILHRIVKAGETFTCIGDHQYVYETGVRQDQMIAIATGFYRKGKYVSADSFGYRVYCRVWHWVRPFRYIAFRLGNLWHAGIRRIKRIFGK